MNKQDLEAWTGEIVSEYESDRERSQMRYFQDDKEFTLLEIATREALVKRLADLWRWYSASYAWRSATAREYLDKTATFEDSLLEYVTNAMASDTKELIRKSLVRQFDERLAQHLFDYLGMGRLP